MVWADMPDYPGYQISDTGQVRRVVTKKHAAPPKVNLKWVEDRRDNRPVIKVIIDGKRRTLNIGREVLKAFVGQPFEAAEACHNDGDPWNMSVANLRWGTRKENAQDMVLHGTSLHGERHPAHKLKKEEIPRIFAMRARGLSQRSIAEDVGVCQTHVGRILRGFAWGHATSAGM